MSDAIEVFRDLSVTVADEIRPDVRDDLIASAASPWAVDLERSREIAQHNVSTEDLLVFTREEHEDLPPAFLTLWANDDGYYVPNIVPLGRPELTRKQYNGILEDFAANVLGPVAGRHALPVLMTDAEQTLTDWLTHDAAARLRSFSIAANKSTGASHPADRRRWYAFIISVHVTGGDIGTDRLSRWLTEVDGWDEDAAHALAGDFETSLGLLRQYDDC